MVVKTEGSATIRFTGSLSHETLENWLNSMPAHASLRFHITEGDRPGETAQTTITATWGTL